MKRKSRAELESIVTRLRTKTGTDYTLIWAYGRPRLYAKGESVEVSPRLPTTAMYDWLSAFEDGLDVGYAVGYAAHEKEIKP